MLVPLLTLVFGLSSIPGIVHGHEARRPHGEAGIETRQVTTANLLTPGDFEKGKWGNWRVIDDLNGIETPGTRSVVSPGYASQKAGSIFQSQKMAYPNIKVTKGMLYDFSLYLNFSSLDCSLTFSQEAGILLALGGIYSHTGIVPTEWARYGASFVAPRSVDRLVLEHNCYLLSRAPTTEFDNIELISAGPKIYNAKTEAVGPNLIKDPNFDSGTLSAYGWLPNGVNSTFAAPGYKKAGHALEVQFNKPSGPQGFTLAQVLTATPGAVYRFSIAYNHDIPLGNCSLTGYLGPSDPGNFGTSFDRLVFGISAANGNAAQAGAWALAQGFVAAPAAGLLFRVELSCPGPVAATWLFGDVEFVPLG